MIPVPLKVFAPRHSTGHRLAASIRASQPRVTVAKRKSFSVLLTCDLGQASGMVKRVTTGIRCDRRRDLDTPRNPFMLDILAGRGLCRPTQNQSCFLFGLLPEIIVLQNMQALVALSSFFFFFFFLAEFYGFIECIAKSPSAFSKQRKVYLSAGT